MKVSELMKKDPLAVTPDEPLAGAIALMAAHSLRHLPVVEHGRLVGLVSERDLLEATGWNPDRYSEADRSPKVVRDFMSVPVETIAGDEELHAAIDLILQRRFGCLVVVDAQGRLEGLLTVTDLIEAQLVACVMAPGLGELDALVASCMSEAPVTADSRITVAEAVELCHRNEVRHLPVDSDGWFVGLISDRDLRLRVGLGEPDRPIEEIMSTRLVTLGPESLVSDAAELMRSRRVESVPVTREGRLLGILTATDVLKLLHERLMPRYESLRP